MRTASQPFGEEDTSLDGNAGDLRPEFGMLVQEVGAEALEILAVPGELEKGERAILAGAWGCGSIRRHAD